MNVRMRLFTVVALTATGIAGCASGGYSPPPERRGQNRCPPSQVWVCEDRYPSRIEDENGRDAFCRCEDPARIR